MVFIRKKTIYNQDYAYLVKNKWTSKGSRQKAKYLGKVLTFEIVNEVDFETFLDDHPIAFIRRESRSTVVDALIRYELFRRGFEKGLVRFKDGTSKDVLNNGTFYYEKHHVRKITTGKEVVVEMHEGFFCHHSFDMVVKARLQGYDEREKGIGLAKVLLEAGLKVERELFVELFSKWEK